MDAYALLFASTLSAGTVLALAAVELPADADVAADPAASPT